MSTDVTKPDPPMPALPPQSDRKVRIFTYPKIIFMMPTFLISLVCGIGMMVIGDKVQDPSERAREQAAAEKVVAEPDAAAPAVVEATPPVAPDGEAVATETDATPADDGTATRTDVLPEPAPELKVRRFGSTQNFLAVAFMVVFGLNLIIMAIDFPRFTVIALVLGFVALGFFVLWLNVYFELLPPLIWLLDKVYLVANAEFYFAFATIILFVFATVWITRYLDYWEVLPNEILHNHGPFSDLERFPTFQLKFDKEIPDILEYALLRSGTLVFHIPGQARSIVLENVLWINSKEDELKRLLGSMEVRFTPDQTG